MGLGPRPEGKRFHPRSRESKTESKSSLSPSTRQLPPPRLRIPRLLCRKTMKLQEGNTLTKRHIMRSDRLVAVCCGFLATHALVGQVKDPTLPDRGMYPLASQLVSDFETINTATGNLVYQFPLAKLPPGRAGFTADLNLIYNSAIYDVKVTDEQ